MNSWTEGALAVIVMVVLGVGLFLFTGESIGDDGGPGTTQPVSVDPEATLPNQFVGETDIDLTVHCLLQDDRFAGRLNDGSPGSRASP